MTAPLLCCICNHPIPVKGTWKYGNNAEPVMEGRCCDACDNKHVIPMRLAHLRMRKARFEAEDS